MTKITKHISSFKFAKDSNKYLQLADAFLEDHPQILFWTERNSTKNGLFYIYNGGYYSAVSTFEVEQMLLDYKPDETNIVIPSLLSHGKQMEVMRYISQRRFFYREVFNPDGIINFTNGVLDITTKELKPHSMDFLTTSQLPYAYDPEANCPCFMNTLNESTSGNLEEMKIIQEFAGYCLIKSNKFERALFIIGAAGSGKSTILDAIEVMLGSVNVSHTTMDQLSNPTYAGNFFDKNANIDHEIPRNIKNYEEAWKKIVDGKVIKVNTKFIPSYDVKPTCKLIFAANDMPIISDSSHAVFRRLLIIYFNNVVKKVDFDLSSKIEKEASGIFNWAFEGLERLLEQGDFTKSDSMIKNIEELKTENNPVYYFINEKYDVGVGEENFVTYNDIYSVYKDFCHEVGAKGIFKKPMLGKEIKKIFHNKITYGQKSVNGVTVKAFFGIRKKRMTGNSEEIQWD